MIKIKIKIKARTKNEEYDNVVVILLFKNYENLKIFNFCKFKINKTLNELKFFFNLKLLNFYYSSKKSKLDMGRRGKNKNKK